MIEKELAPLKARLRNHRLYSQLKSMRDIRHFMQMHVFAVWDFMSLLKSLQHKLSCTTVPWKPVKNARLARFVNEIVWGEESDIDQSGQATSHFEMYLEAMKEVGARTDQIDNFIKQVNRIEDIQTLIEQSDIKSAAQDFMKFTFEIIAGGESHKIASAFAFGREDLIPDIFIEIIHKTEKKNAQKFPRLLYYLQRHIEVDGDEHGPLAMEMIRELCGEDDLKWEETLTVARQALEARIALWDGIAQTLVNKRSALIML